MMSGDLQRYRCRGCGVIFMTDLELDEIRFCVCCASPGTMEIASTRLTLCSDCGATIAQHEARACGQCSAPLCAECAADLCQACSRQRDWIDMPTQGIQ